MTLSRSGTAPPPPEPAEAFVEARAVRRSFDNGRTHALRGVDLRIAAAESVAIMGPSGSGKSTLLHIIGALDRPTSGEVLVAGRSLHDMGDIAAFRARTVGFVFQSFNLLPTLTALENVQMPMFEVTRSTSERRARAEALLERVGMVDHRHQLPAQLSGGERQRVAIARSLANGPRLLLADEPTGNLDSANSEAVIDLLDELRRERGMTLVVVTHSPAVAARASRTIQLLDGRHVE